jgi:hypothetical protein
MNQAQEVAVELAAAAAHAIAVVESHEAWLLRQIDWAEARAAEATSDPRRLHFATVSDTYRSALTRLRESMTATA